MMKSEKDGILERTKLFALLIIRLYSSLPKTTEAHSSLSTQYDRGPSLPLYYAIYPELGSS